MAILYSVHMTANEKKLVAAANAKLNVYYGDIIAHWNEATPAQKAAFIEGSPLLKWIIEWAAQWKVSE